MIANSARTTRRYDVGQWYRLLNHIYTGWLEGGIIDASDVVGAEVATLLISSRSFVFLGRPDPPRRYLPSVIHCCQHRATISLRPRWRPISIR
ncbi:hypothetical protein TNCV_3726151 [Trichonephila clavipes]|nr:hypothetical protein TNCV_3726151 [Trichonephila clavipes]